MWTCFVRRCVQISISNKFTAVWDCPSLRCRCVCRFLYTYSTFEWLYFRYERHQKQKKEKEEHKKQHNNHTHIYIEAAAASRLLVGCWLRIYFIWMKICLYIALPNKYSICHRVSFSTRVSSRTRPCVHECLCATLNLSKIFVQHDFLWCLFIACCYGYTYMYDA